ncbi:HNH endonuclease [Antricoccus suffuscus]|uniref:HNH endonuclease n=1 Tax=Antricoccus suffuscus TaxID=1629062 RepID=A0A2T1A699_9ACTN|nr:HNH endonuclease signature motif containing protein [Antricoccus suffuscus]PRZ44119.1 HNH endonuclease [Antricoccus suffuscus]
MSVAYLSGLDALTGCQHAFTDASRELVATSTRGALSGLGPVALIQFAREVEQARNSLAVLDHAIIGALEDTRAADVLTARNVTNLLADTLHLTHTDARHRVEAAAALGQRVTLGGQPLAPVRPYLAERQRAGRVTAAQARIIYKALHRLDGRPGIRPADLEEAETILASHTDTLGPKDLDGLASEISDRLDPDGDEPRDAERRRQRAVHLHDNGTITGHATAELLAKLRAVLDPLAAPRAADVDGRDKRTGGQRMHDALLDACNRLLDTNPATGRGGIRGTVITTIRLEDLMAGCGYATSTHGVRVPVRDLLAEAAHLKFLPAVLDSNGVVLHLGHAARLASDRQFAALVARDGGCSFPGCDVPPEWCQVHHVIAWRDGGATDIDGLTLACGYHHREFENRGWKSLMINGLPHWRPPVWIDATRTPILHHRITLNNRHE